MIMVTAQELNILLFYPKNNTRMASKLGKFLNQISSCLSLQDGNLLASQLSIRDGHASSILKAVNSLRLDELSFLVSSKIPSPWSEIVLNHLAVLALLNEDGQEVALADAQINMTQNFFSFLSSLTRWVLPIVQTFNQELYLVCVEADKVMVKRGANGIYLEKAARIMNKAFSACATDRYSQLEDSRKWGVYGVVNILFKTYFKLSSTNLCGTILRSIGSADLPSLTAYPKSEQVTFKYYTGVLSFYNERFEDAAKDLLFALKHGSVPSDKATIKNKIIILRYLIPTQIIRGNRPDPKLLIQYESLKIYSDIITAIQQGNLFLFDKHFDESQATLIKWGTWLVVERARLIVVRILFKLAWTILGKPSRLSIELLQKVVNISMQRDDVSSDEVCCLVVNLIDKVFMKGYLSHEKMILVLSQKDPFP